MLAKRSDPLERLEMNDLKDSPASGSNQETVLETNPAKIAKEIGAQSSAVQVETPPEILAQYEALFRRFQDRLQAEQAQDLFLFLDDVQPADTQVVFKHLLGLKIAHLKKQNQTVDEQSFLDNYGAQYRGAIKSLFAKGMKFGDGLVGVGYLSSGGMGDIYLATSSLNEHQTSMKMLGQNVLRAVKVTRNRRLQDKYDEAYKQPHFKFGDFLSEVEARFIREIDVTTFLTSCSHPRRDNVVKAYSSGQTQDGELYLALEYIQGANLTEFLEKYHAKTDVPLPVGALCALLFDVAETLAFFHEYVIHRDIKPLNLMISFEDNRVRVLDFGLAKLATKAAQDGPQLTVASASQFIGTPVYASPEQLLDSSSVDRTCDIYSLGCTMFQLLDEKHQVPYPLSGGMKHPRQLVADRAGKPMPQIDNKLVGKPLREIVSRSLEPNANKRYQSASEIAADLKRFANHDELTEVIKFVKGETTSPPVAASSSGLLQRLGGWFSK